MIASGLQKHVGSVRCVEIENFYPGIFRFRDNGQTAKLGCYGRSLHRPGWLGGWPSKQKGDKQAERNPLVLRWQSQHVALS